MTRRTAVVLALLTAACAIEFKQLERGTTVAVSELAQHRADLDGFILDRLAAKKPKQAFYALELRKTKTFTGQALMAQRGQAAGNIATDLRPMFDRMVARVGTNDDRGLVLVEDELVQVRTHTAEREDLVWRQLALFEQRTDPPVASHVRLPYGYAARGSYGVSTVEETVRLLGWDELLLSYFVSRGDMYVFVVRPGRRLLVVKLAAAAADARAVAARLHEALSSPPSADSPDWNGPAAELHAMLLGPLSDALSNPRLRSIYISADGFIANVPFSVLVEPATGKPLVHRLRTVYTPSASILRAVLDRPLATPVPRILAIGNPTYPAGVKPLNNAEKEAPTVSEMFPGSVLLLGGDATESRVRELAPEFSILHFATHGVLLGRTMPDASSLLLASDPARDGFFTAAEIATLDLSHTLVAVLSACETSVQESGIGAGELGSITSAFLSAGARSVIGSLWKVDDAGTSRLMLAFYERFLALGPGEALRQAQVAMSLRPEYSHPYYWAAFALYGWAK